MPPMIHTFKYGRTDCDHPDAPDTNDEGKFNFPSSHMNANENMAYFADEFDMHEEWEVVSKNIFFGTSSIMKFTSNNFDFTTY